MKPAAWIVVALLVLGAAAGALLVAASLYGVAAGDRPFGDGLSEGKRGTAALYAGLLTAGTLLLALLARGLARGAGRPLRVPPRALAAALAPVAVLAGVWVSFLAMIASSALQRPDPAVPDGDPCCAYPDTWGDVAGGGVLTLVLGVVAVGLAATGLSLGWVAAAGRWPGALHRRPAAARVTNGLWIALAALVTATWLIAAVADGEYP